MYDSSYNYQKNYNRINLLLLYYYENNCGNYSELKFDIMGKFLQC